MTLAVKNTTLDPPSKVLCLSKSDSGRKVLTRSGSTPRKDSSKSETPSEFRHRNSSIIKRDAIASAIDNSLGLYNDDIENNPYKWSGMESRV
eukprot:CAMPEP_0172517942 /NCGR_PEP_ID=MMETSP1066-20121228/289132_1 /TAXON_ID=671091 /ORGANISM="Coscinodiscus wailesii, Strain CCMP2513" /LENGTH=91 /DNA_ID=CAMNT_0013300169 /DNA_START=47 /DNA_END=319 /DNA_ORIENTATION=+